jgi:hypothetical protein
MRQAIWLLALGTALVGCQTHEPFARTASDQQMFGPTKMRLHPTFTQIKDWSGKGKPDGIEAVVEMQDQFGEPTRASGRFIFELYAFESANPDPKGARVGGPWLASLQTRDDQLAHWNSALRSYSFQLADPTIRLDHDYVLTAQMDLNGGRLFDQIIIEANTDAKKGRRVHRSVRAAIQEPTR